MITKAQIEDLVESGAKEHDLQKLLKEDLSIFAEVYANPNNEYICFSEFPVGNTGFVDFVIFTHRSTMSIYLIEVKGANFNLVNQSKGTFHADFLEGIDQIIRRMSYIKARNLEFRKEVHDVRRKVESGQSLYNSLLGPERYLKVDPQKPVNVYGVVIGGRRVHDHEETDKRNEWKSSINFELRLESWDSWLGKVIRS